MACNYPDREAVIVAYLYDDVDAAERVAFESHVTSCLVCRSELADFRGVRSTIAKWAPPVPERAFSLASESRAASFEPRAASHEPRAWWHQVPVWAQLAAAMLVLGVSASIANLDVRYDRANGLNVRTGWTKPAAQLSQTTQPADSAPWRAELAAMREQLQSEMRAQAATVRATAAPASQPVMSDAQLTQRVRLLIEESEKKQDQELALHLMQLQKDANVQRTADVRRTNQLFREITNTYGDQIANQQRQINYLLPAAVPASQR
jgi:hypothetical protein